MKIIYILLSLIGFILLGCKKQEEPQPNAQPIIYGNMKGIVVLNGLIEGSPVEITSLYSINKLYQSYYENSVYENHENNSIEYRYPRSGGGVKVSLKNGSFEAVTYSDTNGLYQFDNIPIGTSQLTLSKAGYGTCLLTATLTGGGKIPVRNFTVVLSKLSTMTFAENTNDFGFQLQTDDFFRKQIYRYVPIKDYPYEYTRNENHRCQPIIVVISKDSLLSNSNYNIASGHPFDINQLSVETQFNETLIKNILYKQKTNIKLSKQYVEQNFKIGDIFYVKVYGMNMHSTKYYNEKGQIVEPSANEDNALLMKFEYTNKNFCKRIFKDGEIESILAKDTLK